MRYPFLSNNYLGKKLLLLNALIGKTYFSKSFKKKGSKIALYFDGCFNKYINPETENAVKTLLNGCDIHLVKKDFECCGVSFLNDGNLVEFEKIIQKNLSVIDCDYDFILTDCASCQDVLAQYKDFSSDELAVDVANKLINVLDLIQNIKFSAKSNCNVSIHLPCHEKFDLKSFVKNIDNISYVEVEDYDSCCGFSGTFAVKNNDVSVEISKTKATKYLEQNVDFVLTTCPACVLGLEQGFIETQCDKIHKPKVMNLFVFLAKYCNIDGFIS
jgi:glycolate oxidase iron-sulfur subunit